VQSGGYRSPNRLAETIDVSPEDAVALTLTAGELVRISSRRGSIEAPVRIDHGLRPGLVFMTPHFTDEVDVNVLTIDATDPKSGTAEFKAAAVRIDKLPTPAAVAGR
jgi:anaerobic selenocysteine-containing dehydrogenase